LLRSQIRASEELREEGVLAPLSHESSELAGLRDNAQWRSPAFYEHMALLRAESEGLGPQPGMPRAVNQQPTIQGYSEERERLERELHKQRGSFRARLPVLRGGPNQFSGRDYRLEDEPSVANEGRPAMALTDLLTGLQTDTGLDAATVNQLYLNHRVWAAASVEYAEVGSLQLIRLDFCRCVLREGLCASMAVADCIFNLLDHDSSGQIDSGKFVRGWARFHPSEGLAGKVSLLPQLFGRQDSAWLRISESAAMLDFLYNLAGYKGKASLDEDVVRLLAACGTDQEGRVNAELLCNSLSFPEWREHFQHAFDDLFWAACHDTCLGYPNEPHRTTFHDGRPGTKPAMGVPDINIWQCGPGGALGYGGK